MVWLLLLPNRQAVSLILGRQGSLICLVPPLSLVLWSFVHRRHLSRLHVLVQSPCVVCLATLVFYQAGFQEPQILVLSALKVARALLGSSHLTTNMTCVYVPQYIYKIKNVLCLP